VFVEVFVWGFGVLFLSCACVSGVLFSLCVCVCVCVCDLLIFVYVRVGVCLCQSMRTACLQQREPAGGGVVDERGELADAVRVLGAQRRHAHDHVQVSLYLFGV